jgi:hypothetical protein
MLRYLNMSANDIGSPGAIALAKALHLNETIQALDIGKNPIGENGGMQLAAMLQVRVSSEPIPVANEQTCSQPALTTQINLHISYLDISYTSLSATPLIAVATAAQTNPTLTSLKLGGNITYLHNLSQTLQLDVTKHLGRLVKLNTTLQSLDLCKMAFQDVNMIDTLADCLRSNHYLTEVNLSG